MSMKKRRRIKRTNRLCNETPAATNSDIIQQNPHEGFCHKHFWKLGLLVILALVCTQVFDYSLRPFSYSGLFIARPFHGLHDWHTATQAVAARDLADYGLWQVLDNNESAKGNPSRVPYQAYASYPSLETYISALCIRVFGAEEWVIRLADLLLAVAVVVPSLFFLRHLYGPGCALLSMLILTLLPLNSYFGHEIAVVAFSLWLLYLYLHLTQKLKPNTDHSRSRLLVFSLALFLAIQVSWQGVFYIVVMILHYVITCLYHRTVQSRILLVLILLPLLSCALKVLVMARPSAALEVQGGTTKVQVQSEPEQKQGLVEQAKALYQRYTEESRHEAFSWSAWFKQQYVFAVSNFTIPVLVLLVFYLAYWLMASMAVSSWTKVLFEAYNIKLAQIPYNFKYMWYFLLPGVVLQFAFKA